MRKIWGLLLITLFTTASCVFNPPEDAQIVTLPELIQEMVERFNTMDWSDKEAVLQAQEDTEKIPRILYLPSGTRIRVTVLPSEPESNSVFYTIGHNAMKQTKELYLTDSKREGMLFSYDLETWYSPEYDPEKNLINVYNDMVFSADWTEDSKGRYLDVTFSGSYKVNDISERKPAKFRNREKRPVIQIEKGMKFYVQDSGLLPKNNTDKIDVNLEENIIMLPAGSEYMMDFNITGNIINMTSYKEYMEVEFFKDLYFYSKPSRQMIAISFDRETWGIPIGDFDIQPDIEVKVLSDIMTQIKFHASVEYEGKGGK